MKIKKNDNVIVITGKDKGKKGKVVKALPREDKVVVEGVNMVKKHKKNRSSDKKGEVIEVAAPIHVSNVKLDKAPAKTTAKKAAPKTKTSKK